LNNFKVLTVFKIEHFLNLNILRIWKKKRKNETKIGNRRKKQKRKRKNKQETAKEEKGEMGRALYPARVCGMLYTPTGNCSRYRFSFC
jgi:hypothetical protein